MVHFPSGIICLLRNYNIPIPIPLSPLFPGASLQTDQSGLGYVNISSKILIIQGIALLIFLLVLFIQQFLLLLLLLLFSLLLLLFSFVFTTFCWGHLQIILHRQCSSQCAQRICLSLSWHMRSSPLYCGVSACPAKCNDAISRSFCFSNTHI